MSVREILILLKQVLYVKYLRSIMILRVSLVIIVLILTRSESIYSSTGGERFSRVGSSPADLHGMWYPTLRRTLMCLSKLYRCVDKAIFQVGLLFVLIQKFILMTYT